MTPFSSNSRDTFYSLSSISLGIRDAFQQQFGERSFWIVAEISDLNVRKGHCYLSLVEKLPGTAAPVCELKGIIWANKFEKIAATFASETGVPLAVNTKILFLASVRFDVKWGLSLVVDDIEPKYTIGLLQLERDRTVARLKADGEYGLNKQVGFPLVPQRIAVISAMDSKGYEDFQNKLLRNPYGYFFNVRLFPSLLQGDGAAAQMTTRLVEIFNNIHNFDLVAIVRGGGGTIDLNCFNDYKLARAVARFPIPVITGVGHTTNISVADEVAFADCITPTDAADYIVQKTLWFEQDIVAKLESIIDNYDAVAADARTFLSETATLITAAGRQFISSSGENLSAILKGLQTASKIAVSEALASLRHTGFQVGNRAVIKVNEEKTAINKFYMGRLKRAPVNLLEQRDRQIIAFESSARQLDPENILKRGFSITRKNGKALLSSGSLNPGDLLITQFYEGTIKSKVGEK
ncbi:MAG TPA: exodeoxyribonuclease VII large subunit [Bacteroidia bacterium]|nr:exodeoxyribonuclease VII large subunit [Bacteroidia bacterium]